MYSSRLIYNSWQQIVLRKSIIDEIASKIIKCRQHTAPLKSAHKSGGTQTIFTKDNVKPVFRCANEHPDKIALHDVNGEFTYKNLFLASVKLSKEINRILKNKQNERVAFLCPNDASYVITQWAAWMSGQIIVPLSKLHPPSLLEYYISDSCAQLLITTSEYSDLFNKLGQKCNSKLLVLDDNMLKEFMEGKPKTDEHFHEPSMTKPAEPPMLLDAGLEPEFYRNNPALIIYTSGTTGPPKGVVLTHNSVCAQVSSMIEAWGWTPKDVLLHCLPLHHVHGIVNALITPLSVGAKCIMLSHFSANDVWTHLLAIKKQPNDRVNMFTGVPTMYSKLIEEFDELFDKNKRQADFIKANLTQRLRLMISGSAPLPSPILERWKEISGHTILERYGMTETGMVLSNLLHGERRPSSVGQPMPYVKVRIVNKDSPDEVLVEGDSSGSNILKTPTNPDKGIQGELLVKGPTVFKAYWNKPKSTDKQFTQDGWFKTGDTVEFVDNHYRILGRTSVDIIKTGGFKVSALDVETNLLTHPHIQDVAVVGVPDMTWGEKVACVVVLKKNKTLELAQLREWSKEKLAPYSIPTELRVTESIPRNAMGKINKKDLLRDFFLDKQ